MGNFRRLMAACMLCCASLDVHANALASAGACDAGPDVVPPVADGNAATSTADREPSEPSAFEAQLISPDHATLATAVDMARKAAKVARACSERALRNGETDRQGEEKSNDQAGTALNVRAMRADVLEAGAALTVLNYAATHPALLASPVSTSMYLRKEQARAEASYRLAAQRAAALSNQYGVYAGLAYSLDAKGSLIPGGEVMFRMDNEASNLPVLCPKFKWCRRFTDISYQRIAAVDVPDVPQQPLPGDTPPIGTPDPGAPDNMVQLPSNAFDDAGGYFRFNTGAKMHFYDWIGLAAGAGLSSRPSDGIGGGRFQPRGFLALSTLTMFGDGAQSQMLVGYAYDKFWEREEYRDPLQPQQGVRTVKNHERVFLDAVMMIPGLRPAGFSVAARLWIDAPLEFDDSPSEARASLLFYQDFSGWTRLFNPLLGGLRGGLGQLGLWE